MIRCGTFRHVCRFYQSLDPRLQICSCGAVQEVCLMGDPDMDDDVNAGEVLSPEERAMIDDEDDEPPF